MNSSNNIKISKKKKEEFDSILITNSNNIILQINLFRILFNSDFYEHFIEHIKNKIEIIITNNDIFYLHIDISSFILSDLLYYDKILKFAQLLHEFSNKLLNIYIYGSSFVFTNLISMINSSLNSDITKKIIFENVKIFNSRFHKISNCNQQNRNNY